MGSQDLCDVEKFCKDRYLEKEKRKKCGRGLANGYKKKMEES